MLNLTKVSSARIRINALIPSGLYAQRTVEIGPRTANSCIHWEGLGRVRIVVRLNVELSLGLLGHQVRTNEGIQVAVHDAIYLAGFKFGAVVLDQAVRLHDVGSDLTAKGNVQLAFVELVCVRLALLDFQIVEARAKHLHSQFAILALTALCLASNDDVGCQAQRSQSKNRELAKIGRAHV